MKNDTPYQTGSDNLRTSRPTSLAIKQLRNAAANMSKAALDRPGSPERKLSVLLEVLANSAAFWGAKNQAQVEGALEDYFTAAGEAK